MFGACDTEPIPHIRSDFRFYQRPQVIARQPSAAAGLESSMAVAA